MSHISSRFIWNALKIAVRAAACPEKGSSASFHRLHVTSNLPPGPEGAGEEGPRAHLAPRPKQVHARAFDERRVPGCGGWGGWGRRERCRLDSPGQGLPSLCSPEGLRRPSPGL